MKILLSKFAGQTLSREQMKSVQGGWHCITVHCTNSQQYAQNSGHACGHNDEQRHAQGQSFAQSYCNHSGTYLTNNVPVNQQ